MILLFLGVLISFVLIVSVATIITNQTLKEKIFKLKNEYTKISCVQVLSNLINKKLRRTIYPQNFISKTKFNSLNLIVAPVYLINGGRLGDVHLKFYAKALERINQPMNLVLLDGDIKINNEKINVVYLKSNALNYETLAIINQLNVNKYENLNHKKTLEIVGNFNETISLKDIDEKNIWLDILNQKAKVRISESCNLKIDLKINPFNYIMKGKANKVAVFDIFGEKVVEIFGRFKAELHDFVLLLKVVSACELVFNFNYKHDILENLKLLDYEIEYEANLESMKKLKQRALTEIKHSFLNVNDEISKFKFKDLNEFFKITNLRKNYLNDYIYLLKHIFGLNIKNGILTAKPIHLVENRFTVSYILNEEKFDVKFVSAGEDSIKLNHVGHKLGVKEKFVYNF